VRFAFGAGIAAVAGLVGIAFGSKTGGVLLAFPAILPASLTLIARKEGKDEAAIDSVGAILGSAALVAYAVVIAATVTRWGFVASVLCALGVWLVVAVGLYSLVALVYKREPR
jgi:Protein of unknown function (DUF3147)